MFGEKHLKTKIKSHNNKINTNFDGKAPKEGIECVSLLAIVIHSDFKPGENYYSQTFLEERKCKTKEEISSLAIIRL